MYGNTALHWAIVAKNNTAISTLVQHGATLDVPNFRNETPMTLLGPHIGAAWLGSRISQEIREKQGRTRTWCRDKVNLLINIYSIQFFEKFHQIRYLDSSFTWLYIFIVLLLFFFFSENPLVLYGDHTVRSVLCDWNGSAEWMGLFTKTRCLLHILRSSVSNEPFRVRRTAISRLTDVNLFGNQGK